MKFLEDRASANYAPDQSFSRTKELASWSGMMFYVWVITYAARLDFGKLGWGRMNLKKAFKAPLAWVPSGPVSPWFRLVSALISVVALGLTICYLKKIIEASVWENDQGYGRWLMAYLCFTTSLALLIGVVRDYQKFVYGTPTRIFPAEQRAALCQTILDTGPLNAIKLYRRTVPDASLGEARDYVKRLSAELLAKHPEKFSPPPKLWDLNWQAMGICFIFELCLLAGTWVRMPFAPPGAKIFAFAEAFLLSAGTTLSFRLKSTLLRILAWIGVLFCLPLALGAAIRLSSQAIYFYCLGFPFGVFLVLSGSIRKRRKLTTAQKNS